MNRPISPSALSLDDWLVKMGEQPWTFGWAAIVVFDRAKTNILLMQEYIDRLGTAQQFPVIEYSEVDVGEGIKHALMGLTLDSPRLSFENASIEYARAAATLRMVGGKQLQMNESVHAGETYKVVTRLSTLNAIVGPSLIFDADLATATGSVSAEGAVVLDLFPKDENGKLKYQYRFTGVETEFERIKMGTHLAALMDAWGEKLTRLTLSELRESQDSVLQPERFRVRTHADHNSAKRGDPAFGKGAVVLFIAMKGDANGTFPDTDKDMVYMLPESVDKFTSNLIVAQELIWNKVVLPAIKKVPWVEELALENREIPGSRHRQLVATSGALTGKIEVEFPMRKYDLPEFSMKYSGDQALRFYVSGDSVRMEFKPDPVYVESTLGLKNQSSEDPWYYRYATIKVEVEVEVVFRFVVEEVDGRPAVVLKFDRQLAYSNWEIDSFDGGANDREWIETHLAVYKWKLQGPVDELVAPLSTIGATLDAFRLNNLLFSGDNVVTPGLLHQPGDLTVLGHLSPRRTDLVIEPSEAVVAGDGSLKFEASGGSDIKWGVVDLDGEESDANGKIDLSGKYTAPSADSVRESGSRRVIVTATQGDKVSKAMISLVESSVSVYPSVVVVALGGKHSLVAGEVDKKALTWNLKDQALGALETDPDKDPTMQDGRKFVAATQLPAPGASDPYNYYSSRLAEVEVSNADKSKRTIDVLVVQNQSGSYWLEAEVSGAGVQLKFYRTTMAVPKEEVPAASTHWHKYKGDGTFENGLYTPKAGSAEQYAIVTAFYYDGESVDRFAYMIIPVPFVSSQQFVQLLGTEEVK